MGPNTQNQSSGSTEPRVPATPSASVRVDSQQPAQPVSQARAVNPAPVQIQTNEHVSQTVPATKNNFVLPKEIISRTHLSRCLRELQKTDDFFHQASIKGGNVQQIPDVSRELEGLMRVNGLNLLQAQDRDKMKSFLANLKSKAPVVHMSFPSEAGTAFLSRLLEWYRREAHPYTVLHVGLQPELAAGCIVRTTNKYHDFSFRKRFEKSKSKLIEQLELASKQVASEIQTEAVAATQPAQTSAPTMASTPVSTPVATPAPAVTPVPTSAPTSANPQPGESK